MFVKYACAYVNLSALAGSVLLAFSGYGVIERRDWNSDTIAYCFQLRIVSELPWHVVIIIIIINNLILIVTNFNNHTRLPVPYPLTVPRVSSSFCAYARISLATAGINS